MSDVRETPVETLRALKELFARRGLAPSKRFGQNFLVDSNILDAIARAADLSPADVCLEVGPGAGSLTRRLLDRAAKVISVEIDQGLHALVKDVFGDRTNLTLLHTDVMATKTTIAPAVVDAIRSALSAVPDARFKVVANLPYNISTPFLASLFLGVAVPERMTLLVQKELAQGLSAPPGEREYSPLTVLFALLGRSKIDRTVPGEAFWPRPDVTSAVVVFERTAPDIESARRAYPLAAFLFGERRKTVASLLRKLPDALGGPVSREEALALLRAIGADEMVRAEALPPSAFIELCRALERNRPL